MTDPYAFKAIHDLLVEIRDELKKLKKLNEPVNEIVEVEPPKPTEVLTKCHHGFPVNAGKCAKCYHEGFFL